MTASIHQALSGAQARSVRPASQTRAARPTRVAVVCQASRPDHNAGFPLGEHAKVLLTGLAASLALSAGSPAFATETAAPVAPVRQPAELQAEVEKRNTEALTKLTADLEASKAAAVKSVGELQKRLASEHAQMLKLQVDLKKAREALSDSQKEVEKEKTLLVAAKKQATEASEAARQAELALRGQAGLESLKSPLGLAATSGWTLAGIIAVTRKKKQDEDEVAYASGMIGNNEMRKTMDAVRAEADTLRRDLTAQQSRLKELTAQLEQERGQNSTLRETVLIMEAEVTDLEARMTMAKTEAFELQRKLESALQSQGRGNDVKPANLSLFGGSSSSASKPSSSTPKYQPPVRSTGSNIASSKASSTYGSSSSAMTGSGKAVRVTFALQQELPFGQSLKLVGSHPALGGWKEDMGLVMQWTEGHRWSAAVSLPAGTALEFKAVKVIGGEGGETRSEWEDGPNHVLLIPSSGYDSLNAKVEWGGGTAVLDHVPASSSGSMKKEAKVGARATSGKWGGLLG